MAQRRFGPTRGAGVAIIEKQAQTTIEGAALGVTAYTGIMQKGPVGKLFRAKTRKEFQKKAGSYIPESLLPDNAFDFFKVGKGAGELWLNRVTDGSEKKSKVTILNRRSPRGEAILVEAGNGGRWAGKKAFFADKNTSKTANTLQMTTVPAGLKEDQLVGGLVKFSILPGKSYKIVANTAAGLLTFASDVQLIVDLGIANNLLYSITLLNDGLSLGVKITEGTDDPVGEWNMEVYAIEGGAAERVKNFENLSSDPAAPNYFVKVINDDSDSDYYVKVTDLFIGSPSADAKPGNVTGKSLTLTETVLTAKIHDEVPSSVLLATAVLKSLSLGASVQKDNVLLTVLAAGARATGALTFTANPADNDTVTINGKVITFKTVVVTPASQVLIGAAATDTIDNLVAFINASSDVLLLDIVFAEKLSATVMNLFACTAGVAGNAIATLASGANHTWGAATLLGGIAQTWTYASEAQPLLTGLVVTSGVAFVAPNEFGFGFTLIDTSKSSAKLWAVADTLTLPIYPLEVNALKGGLVVPKVSAYRKKYQIASNTANQITAKVGSTMLADGAVAGDDFRVEYIQELGAGYDGVADILDIHYENAYDPGSSKLRNMRGKNLGLIKLGTPGVTSTAVQKAGAAFAESQNWQYRYEVPANILDEQSVEEYLNETIGRNDFAVVAYPSYGKVSNPVGAGTKLVSLTGAVHGYEALSAKNNDGYHKAAAGVDAILSGVLALPEGLEDVTLDEEFLNPQGINVIKFKEGNAIIWGDRTLGLDPAFKFKHQRETLSHYENIFLENFDFIIFALNNVQSQKLLKSAFLGFFTPEFAKGAIEGKDVQDAAQVKIDEENNTQLTKDNGDLNAEIGVRLVNTVERFIITISKLGITESTGA